MPRISRSRISARTRKFFSPCMPVSTNELLRSALVAIRRFGGSFFWSSNTVASVAPGSRMRKVSIWNWPCADLPARAAADRGSGACASLVGRPSCAPVARSSTMRQPTRSRRFCAEVGERLALGVGQHAGLAEAAVLLERPHGRDRAVAELAVGRPGIVIGPVEVELDGGALRDRHAGIGAGRRGSRPPSWLGLSWLGFLGALSWRGSFFFGAAFLAPRGGPDRRSAPEAPADRRPAARPPTRRPTP